MHGVRVGVGIQEPKQPFTVHPGVIGEQTYALEGEHVVTEFATIQADEGPAGGDVMQAPVQLVSPSEQEEVYVQTGNELGQSAPFNDTMHVGRD